MSQNLLLGVALLASLLLGCKERCDPNVQSYTLSNTLPYNENSSFEMRDSAGQVRIFTIDRYEYTSQSFEDCDCCPVYHRDGLEAVLKADSIQLQFLLDPSFTDPDVDRLTMYIEGTPFYADIKGGRFYESSTALTFHPVFTMNGLTYADVVEFDGSMGPDRVHKAWINWTTGLLRYTKADSTYWEFF